MKKFLSLLLALALCAGLSVPAFAAAGFSDVADSSPFAAAIGWAVEEGITNGITPTTFGPGNTCTTSHILTFLWRASGRPGDAEGTADRDSAAKWAVEQEMIEKNADVSAPCTRSAAVTYIWKSMESPAPEQAASFTDVPAGAEYASAVSWAVENGVTNGTGNGAFSPDAICTRGQIVTFLYRAMEAAAPEPPSETPAKAPEKTPEKAPEKTEEKTPETTPEKAPEKAPDPQPSKVTPEAAAEELVRLLNAERAKAGLPALKTMSGLTQAARVRAKDLSGGYIEIRADGSDWTSVLEASNVAADYVDESIVVGTGYDTAADALEMILSTPTAKAALLNKAFTHLGAGYVQDANGYGGFQDFWSVMYITEASGETSTQAPSGTPAETPSETLAPVPAPSGTDLQSQREGVLAIVNAARAENGAAPLVLDDALCEVAQLRADEIVESFSHTRPNGTSCFTAINEAGISYRTCAENIAAGSATPAGVMDQWMNSSGHRANILNGNLKSIGIGYVKAPSGYQHYWVQMFVG